MGKINKNNPKTKLIDNTPKKKLGTIAKSKDVIKKKEALKTDKSKLLLTKTITPKKTTSKKEKFRQKHTKLMNKFTLIKKQQKEERARKNREKTAVIGDLKPLKDALPSLDDILKLSKEKDHIKTGVKEFDDAAEKKNLNTKQKLKKKKEKFMKQVNTFHTILQDPEFKKNPREAIRYHIQYTHGLIDE